ncbi:MAG: hypothetical protein M0P12_13825 [Paludibacteraceae bacterium]|nr:hypothetical protein [Paludibacteraceae bacterium]
MKRTLIILLLAFISSMSCFAGDVVIDKENCTITKDGKTYNLYGKVEIVKGGADLTVEIVKGGADLDVEIVNGGANKCGNVEIVNGGADVEIEIVNGGADLKVEIVNGGTGIK